MAHHFKSNNSLIDKNLNTSSFVGQLYKCHPVIESSKSFVKSLDSLPFITEIKYVGTFNQQFPDVATCLEHVFNSLLGQGHECPKCERACPTPLKDLCITPFQHEMRAAPAWAGAYVWW